MRREAALGVLLDLLAAAPERRREVLRGLPRPAVRAITDEWWWQAHGGQCEPDGPSTGSGQAWRVWAIIAGRGFGKTRAGSEWVWARARELPGARIALLAASAEEAARVMVEGESGLLAVARCDEPVRWLRSRGELVFPSGARAFAYSAAQPDQLRGPQHHFAWADELAKWPRAEDAWHNLMLGMRLGERPRTIVTTTPRPMALLSALETLDGSVVTCGRTVDNPHLPADFRSAMTAMYGGTRLGRQELDGVLFADVEGALWTVAGLEASRLILPGICRGGGPAKLVEGVLGTTENPLRQHFVPPPPHEIVGRSEVVRTVVGVDPPATSAGTCGIVVCGGDRDGGLWVLGDHSASGLSPEGWARRVVAAAEAWGADLIVAEKNQGGEMIASVLRGVGLTLPVRLVSATKSKAERAVPVALRFETGQARLGGQFAELEAQLCAFTHQGWEGVGSPDRADAMVWAMTALMRGGGEPSVRGL